LPAPGCRSAVRCRRPGMPFPDTPAAGRGILVR